MKDLIGGVLVTQPTVWDNPNGGYAYTCPFCGASKEVKGGEYVGMNDLKHSDDCTYKLAQKLYLHYNF